MMTADWMSHLSTVIATSPVTLAGGCLACGCLALYAVTRAPEFIVMTGTAAMYAVIAALPFVQG
jgi:hypothetical protein